MTPKWIYYAAGNFGAVAGPMGLSRLYRGIPLAIWVLVLMVSIIGVNLTLWYSLRHRASQVAKRKLKMRPVQFVLIGFGLLLLASSMFASFDQTERIMNVLIGLFAIVFGIVAGIKRKRKPA